MLGLGMGQIQSAGTDVFSFGARLTNITVTVGSDTEAECLVTSDTGDGEVFMVVSPSAAKPSPPRIKTGLIHNGELALCAASYEPSNPGEISFYLTGLIGGQKFYAHFVQESETKGTSGVYTSQPFTMLPDTIAPFLSLPAVVVGGAYSATVKVRTSEPRGILYTVLTKSLTEPLPDQIKVGKNHVGEYVPSANGPVSGTADDEQFLDFGDLQPETTYEVYYMQEDLALNQSNVVHVSFTTTIE